MTSSAHKTAPLTPRPLDPHRQDVLAKVIDNAQRMRGGHLMTTRDGWSYCARHMRGRTHWSVKDASGELFSWGEC